MRFYIRAHTDVVAEFEAKGHLDALESPEALSALRTYGPVVVHQLDGAKVAHSISYRMGPALRWGWSVAPWAVPPEQDEELRATG